MKVSKVIIIVVALHVLVIGGIFVFEGCSRTRVQGPDVVQDQPTPETLTTENLLPPGQIDPLASTMPSDLVPATPEAVLPAPALPTVDTAMAPAPTIPTVPATTTYTVKKGDSLWRIATTEGITVAQLAQANNIDKNSILKIGQTLTIPAKASAAPVMASAPSVEMAGFSPAPAPAAGGMAYTVKSGDSLWKIARAHNTTVSAIKQANGLSSDMLKVGQQLQLPSASATATASSAAPTPAPTVRAGVAATSYTQEWYEPGTTLTQNGKTVHIVDFNDSLGAIAAKYGVSIQALRAANSNIDARSIHPGQPLVIPSTAAPTVVSPTAAATTDASLAAPIVSAPATVN